MNKIVLLIIAAFFAFSIQAQTIPTANTWNKTGFQDSFPNPATVLNILSFGAIPNDSLNDAPAIQAAIAALNGGSGVVFIPAGSYKIQQTISLPDSVILRGAGADSTVLLFDLNGSASNSLTISKSQNSNFVRLSQPTNLKGNKLSVISALPFSAGDWVELRQQNGAWDTKPASWANFSVGQIVQLDSVSGQQLYLADPLRIHYDTALQAEVRKIDPAKQIGVECLKIKRLDNPGSGAGYGIYFNYAVNSWVKGIESDSSVGSHIQAEASAYLTIRDSYFHHAHTYDGSATRGYGVTLAHHTGNVLVENNIFRYLRHAMVVKQGANGNVFGYNYSYEPNRTEFPSTAGGDISLHGHYPFANLFEGNVVQNLHIDQAWGPAGPRNTFFRNKVELFGVIMTSGTVQADSQVFVGNDVPNTGLFMGMFSLSGSGHYTYGNRVRGTVQPAGTTTLPDSSLYLQSKPGFWNSSSNWPAIGVPFATAAATNPALERVQNNAGLAVCNSSPSTPTSISEALQHTLSVFPNPFQDNITISADGKILDENAKLRLINMLGQQVWQQDLQMQEHITADLPATLPSGVYLLQVQFMDKVKIMKLVKE